MTAQQAPSRPAQEQTRSQYRRRRSRAGAIPTPKCQNREFEQAEMSLRQAMQQMPDIAESVPQSDHERDGRGPEHPAGRPGRPGDVPAGHRRPLPRTRPCSSRSARIVDRLPNRIAITGHTDAVNFQGPNGMTNWELSAAAPTPRGPFWPARASSPTGFSKSPARREPTPCCPNDPYAIVQPQDLHPSDARSARVPPGYRLN